MKLVPILLFLGLFSSATALVCLRECLPGETPGSGCAVCPEMKKEDCITKELVRGPCLCKECAKAEGESCGGLYGFSGKCASNLTCELPEKEDLIYQIDWGRKGVCIKKELPPAHKEEGAQGKTDIEMSPITSDGGNRGREGYDEEYDKQDQFQKEERKYLYDLIQKVAHLLKKLLSNLL